MCNKHYVSNLGKHLKFIEKMDIRNSKESLKMYISEEYTRSHDKLLFTCEKGHSRKITAYSVLYGTGCAVCSHKSTYTTGEFKKYLKKNTIWELIKGERYINTSTKLKVRCKNGHIRNLTPTSIISQNVGCAICSKKIKKTTENFIVEINNKRIKNGLPLISLVEGQKYINGYSKLYFKCESGHIWNAAPGTLLHHLTGCPHCYKGNYSKKAIAWLEQIMKKENIHIQHALNGGEYNIPNTKYRADGYCKKTNTIYEFHGDVFHGNLKIFKPTTKCHPFDNTITALELYERTIRKEELIKHLGYNLIVTWETQ